MNYYNDDTIVYLDGKFVKATDAKVDLYSQSLHYGYSVFEGIRSYRAVHGQTKIFKAKEHFERLIASADALNIFMKSMFFSTLQITGNCRLFYLHNMGDLTKTTSNAVLCVNHSLLMFCELMAAPGDHVVKRV